MAKEPGCVTTTRSRKSSVRLRTASLEHSDDLNLRRGRTKISSSCASFSLIIGESSRGREMGAGRRHCCRLSQRDSNYHKHSRRRTSHRPSLLAVSTSTILATIVAVAVLETGSFVVASAHFTEPAQPLVYLSDAGSGDGYPRPVQFRESSSSSSMSPSLIAAKCWNNLENDNDCKNINVITGPSDGSSAPASVPSPSGSDEQNGEDDSLITPVVIFESSSSYDSSVGGAGHDNSATPSSSTDADDDSVGGSPSDWQTTPASSRSSYFYPRKSTTPASPSNNSNVLARNRTPPSSREEIFVTRAPNQPSSYVTASSSHEQQRPTQPTVSVYVATTTQPSTNLKKAHKTTTEGRKCRDENDDDCDEPESKSPTDEGGAGGGGDDDDDDADDSANDIDDESSSAPPSKQDSAPVFDSGSGEPPNDDNEDTEDDADPNGDESFESSGNSDPTGNRDSPSSTGRFIEVSQTTTQKTSPLATTQSGGNDDNAMRLSITTQQGARIEVVVHPTLPPSFPTTTPASIQTTNGGAGDDAPSDSSDRPSTIMPDDTYRSKPVFPSSTVGSGSDSLSSNEIDLPAYAGSQRNNNRSSAADISNSLQSSSNEDATSEPPIDLATFKPIPMMPQVEQPRWPVDGVRNASSDTSSGPNEPSKLPDRYKFESPASSSSAGSGTTTAPAFKFDNAWRAQPVRAPNFQSSSPNSGGSGGPDSWQSQQQQRQRAKFGDPSAAVAAVVSQMAAANKSRQSQETAEMLPTLLLYASICILVVLAIIFVIMAVAIWRQKRARQRALLHKSHMMGAAGGQMVPSLSHASQLLLANNGQLQQAAPLPAGHQQQPGLLTTYGPGKGMHQLQNEITTSLLRGQSDSGDNLHCGEDSDSLNGVGKQVGVQQAAEGSDQSNQTIVGQDPAAGASRYAAQPAPTATNSWSTNEDQTTSATTTSSKGSGGSQDTRADQQVQQTGGAQQQRHKYQQQHSANHQATNGQLKQTQFNINNNSLSDGRQNSSSISDSQESPDHHHDGNQQYLAANQPQAYPPPQQQGYLPRPQTAQQALYSQQPTMQADASGQTPLKRPPFPADQMVMMGPSRSEESFQHQQSISNGVHGGMMTPQPTGAAPLAGNFGQRADYPMAVEPDRVPAPSQPGGYGPPPQDPSRGPSVYPPMTASPASNNGYLGRAPDGFQQPGSRFRNGTSPAYQPGAGPPPPPQNGHAASFDYATFDGPAVNQARVIAMNPLATMSRRPINYQQHHHPGLNRNIYSEDSSSLMTASPSLARTSSSSSFAFNNHHHNLAGLDRGIEAKPMIDPSTGRLFNDYSQANQNKMPVNNGGGLPPPPIVGRKNPGEAWYV